MQQAARLPGGYGIRPYGVGVDARIDPYKSYASNKLKNTAYPKG